MTLPLEAPITIDPAVPVPQHIAIIMDGNRRWAKDRGMPAVMGHWEGAEVLTEVLRTASDAGVKTVTVYAFSTENWKRSKPEVEALMDILETYLIRKRTQMIEDGVRLDAIGDLSGLPENVQRAFTETKQYTAHCSKINLVLAINYGARDELCRAFSKMLKDCRDNKFAAEDVSEDLVASYLDTKTWGDPDLLIRTSGEQRLSNFLLWQISYAEIYIADVLWPEFTEKHLLEAIGSYQKRHRRSGV
jgi:undecaprenyl diphosphate synthase